MSMRSRDGTIVVRSGTLVEAWVPDDLTGAESVQDDIRSQRAFGPGEVWVWPMSMSPPEGWERHFHAAGDEPLVLAVITWVYGDEPAE